MLSGILILWPGIEPVPLALETQSLYHWTDREVPLSSFLLESEDREHPLEKG